VLKALSALFCLVALSPFLGAPGYAQQPSSPAPDATHRRATIELDTNCNWFISEFKGSLKLKASKQGHVGFRAWHPYLDGNVKYAGMVIFRNIGLWQRDYLVMPNSSVTFTFRDLPQVPWDWVFVVHFNELSGHGFANAGAKMVVTGPTQLTLYEGKATVTIGRSEPFSLDVRESDYANYPPWQTRL